MNSQNLRRIGTQLFKNVVISGGLGYLFGGLGQAALFVGFWAVPVAVGAAGDKGWEVLERRRPALAARIRSSTVAEFYEANRMNVLLGQGGPNRFRTLARVIAVAGLAVSVVAMFGIGGIAMWIAVGVVSAPMMLHSGVDEARALTGKIPSFRSQFHQARQVSEPSTHQPVREIQRSANHGISAAATTAAPSPVATMSLRSTSSAQPAVRSSVASRPVIALND